MPHFPGLNSKFTDKLEFVNPEEEEHIPVYRVMNRDGEITDKQNEPTVSSGMLKEPYEIYQLTL